MKNSNENDLNHPANIPVSIDHYVAMSEIHRRIAPSCVSPSINWHIALWPEPNFRAHHDLIDQNAARRMWIEKINQFISQLENVLSSGISKDRLIIPNAENESDLRRALFLPVSGKVASSIFFYWKVKVEVHFEYVTISIFLNLTRSEEGHAQNDDDENSLQFEWPECLSDVTPESLLQSLDAIVNGDLGTETLQASAECLLDRIWDGLEVGVLKGIDTSDPVFGYLFSDFRSIVIDLPKADYPSSLL